MKSVYAALCLALLAVSLWFLPACGSTGAALNGATVHGSLKGVPVSVSFGKQPITRATAAPDPARPASFLGQFFNRLTVTPEAIVPVTQTLPPRRPLALIPCYDQSQLPQCLKAAHPRTLIILNPDSGPGRSNWSGLGQWMRAAKTLRDNKVPVALYIDAKWQPGDVGYTGPTKNKFGTELVTEWRRYAMAAASSSVTDYLFIDDLERIPTAQQTVALMLLRQEVPESVKFIGNPGTATTHWDSVCSIVCTHEDATPSNKVPKATGSTPRAHIYQAQKRPFSAVWSDARDNRADYVYATPAAKGRGEYDSIPWLNKLADATR